ncbi:MbtH family NRPS accessory protein [Xenorhabdus bovienii]|uniref:MbtH family NRPS accessory protein n=1 Tax=Xenorhabdus bovienii TaxID=40576 RepID=A0AAJ1N158_XENBV|nr:MbtH family NRPS accessory protein [Xenorhabdus bovienii]MDE1476891.1 MbtH family NRPS accessory protein [Xenorhabdus bovienii]MDE1485094.1 MbtH family NRPS accessory protein [Xenorhabdus bovienii]MDE1494189.1 MbtH family NRPS accessory protein [Xenorhabdus bovienii]MDE9430278.1 MbtH family NRPS accessory protein [Xenorhabdus bovienii]MDE9444919.1 MbtH family NRPS accessory protein [Xenorhabdus bovienii]
MDNPPTFKVVMNHEEQYSIWPSHLPLPNKWEETGVVDNKENCLAYIDRVWTDMRPLSLRKHMDSMPDS